MDIFYSNNTLYVTLEETMDNLAMEKLKRRIFNILDDYNIDNIILNIMTNTNNYLLDNFIKEYHKKYRGNIKINSIKNY